jgi:outer membrane protein assembly factor BamB
LKIECRLRLGLALGLALGLTACASQPAKAPLVDGPEKASDEPIVAEPKNLPEIHNQIRLKALWRDQVGKGSGSDYLRLTPKVVGSALFAVSYDGVVERRDLETGKVVWSQQQPVEITGAPGFSNGYLLVGSGSGELLKLKATTGERVWQVRVASEVLSEPVSNGNVIVVQTVDGKVSGHRFDTGERMWVYDSNLPVLSLRGTSTPLIADGSVMMGFANGKLISLNIETGAVLWEQRLGIPAGRSELERLVDIDGQMFRRGPYLLALGYNGRFAAMEVRSGRVLWDIQASGYSGPVSGQGQFFITSDNGSVMAYSDRNLAKTWTQNDLQGRQLSASSLLGNYLVVGDFEGYVHLLDTTTGELLGRERLKRDLRQQAQALTFDYRFPSTQYRRNDAITADMLVAENRLISFNKEGRIAVFVLSEAP